MFSLVIVGGVQTTKNEGSFVTCAYCEANAGLRHQIEPVCESDPSLRRPRVYCAAKNTARSLFCALFAVKFEVHPRQCFAMAE